MVSTPEPPDPMETAQAQAGMNRDTALTQQQLNMVNQVTPWGNLTYDQTGSSGFRDSQGNWVETPQYTATTELTPEQQAIFEQTQDAQGNLAGLASDQSGKMRDYLNTPFEFNNSDAEQWAYDLGSQRLDPRLAEQRQRTEESLIARGLRPGSAGWDREMGRMDQSANDAYNQLMLTGRGQAFNEALTERNQPINELSALLSGSQIQAPNFVSTPQTGVGGVDYTGLVNQNYQAEVANQQNMMGGLFGLGAAGIKALPFSDMRLKEDIEPVGKLDNGLTVYRYRMKGDDAYQIGVMAQEVESVVPGAVHMDPSGYRRVDYHMATEAA